MANTRPEVSELGGQNIGFLFGTMMDLRMLPTDIKHTGKVEVGEFKMVAHFPAIHERNGTEAQYLAKHRTFRGGLYATYQDGPYKIDEIKWDATNKAGVHMVTKTKYGQIVEFPTQPSKSMPGSMKLMVQEYVESLKQPQLVIRCSGLGGALEPVANTTDEYQVILLNGDIKCPKSMHSHVPAKYHAEDDGRFDAQIGPWSFHAEEIIDGNDTRYRETTAKRQVTQVQRFDLAVDVDWETQEKVDTKYRQEIEQWAEEQIEEWIDYNIEEVAEGGDGDWELDFDPSDGSDEIRVVFNWQLDNKYEVGDVDYEDEDYWEYSAESEKEELERLRRIFSNLPDNICRCCGESMWTGDGIDFMCVTCEELGECENCGGETFNAPYTGSGALSDVGLSTDQLTSTWGSGDFDKSSLNSSGHMNVFANAEDKHDGFGNYSKPPWVSVGRRTRFMRDKKKRLQMKRKKAETFEAASTASPNLPREQNNVLQAVKAQYPGFSWKACEWGPYFLRFSEDGSNKFYSVWVWESRSGIYTAMGAYGGLGQNPRLFNITQTRDLQSAINEAQKKMKSKTRKGYNTYNAETFEAPMGFNEMGPRPFYGNPRKIAIDRWGNRRFIRRRKDGTYMKNVDVGRSIAMDRRRQSQTWAPSGYRDQGDGSPSLLERLRFRGE